MRPWGILVLAAVWVGLWNDLSWANVVGGVAVGTAVWWVVRPTRVVDGWHHRLHPLRAVRAIAWFTVELVRANLVLAWEIVRPGSRIAPGIVAVPLAPASPLVVKLVADGITLTPGTLTLDVRHDPPVLFVHSIDARDPDAVRRSVLTLDRHVRAALRPKHADVPA